MKEWKDVFWGKDKSLLQLLLVTVLLFSFLILIVFATVNAKETENKDTFPSMIRFAKCFQKIPVGY